MEHLKNLRVKLSFFDAVSFCALVPAVRGSAASSSARARTQQRCRVCGPTRARRRPWRSDALRLMCLSSLAQGLNTESKAYQEMSLEVEHLRLQVCPGPPPVLTRPPGSAPCATRHALLE